MAAELIIAPEAQQDVDEAYCWYEDRRPGLGVVEAISVRHLLRVCRWEGDSLLYLPYIPRSKEVAQSLVVICQASPNLSVHLTGVPLRFTPSGDFIVMGLIGTSFLFSHSKRRMLRGI